MKKFVFSLFLFIYISLSLTAYSQKNTKPVANNTKQKEAAIKDIDSKYDFYKERALQIWNFAEVGYKEMKSSALLQQTLKDAGFTIEAGVAGMPTAFVASFGEGKPVVGILAEFDALPGLSQTAKPEKEPAGNSAGHGCGHHLFGTASVAAGIELKKYLQDNKLKGIGTFTSLSLFRNLRASLKGKIVPYRLTYLSSMISLNSERSAVRFPIFSIPPGLKSSATYSSYFIVPAVGGAISKPRFVLKTARTLFSCANPSVNPLSL